MSALRRGVLLPASALWCWDEYNALSPEQKRLAEHVERRPMSTPTPREEPTT